MYTVVYEWVEALAVGGASVLTAESRDKRAYQGSRVDNRDWRRGITQTQIQAVGIYFVAVGHPTHMRTLPASELRDEFESAVETVGKSNETFIRAGNGGETDVQLIDYTIGEVIELGKSLGTSAFYGTLEQTDNGDPQWARVFFFHNELAHSVYIETEELAQVREGETDEQIEELEQKQKLAEEILENYGDLINRAKEYRLKNNVEKISMEQLFRLQDRLQDKKEEKEREERIDEELEDEIAEKVYNDGRFHSRFNSSDTEMLIKDMGIEFDEDAVRIEVIDRKAKSLIKIEE